MSKNELLKFFETTAVRKDRHDANGDMQAWYIQGDKTTYAFAILRGAHGERKDIPALRTYHVLKGNAAFTIDGKEQQVTAGSKIEIQPHSTYDFRSMGENPVVVFVDVGFKLDLATIPG